MDRFKDVWILKNIYQTSFLVSPKHPHCSLSGYFQNSNTYVLLLQSGLSNIMKSSNGIVVSGDRRGEETGWMERTQWGRMNERWEMKQGKTEEMGMENEGIDGGRAAVCGWATWKWKWATAGLKLGHPAINRVQWSWAGTVKCVIVLSWSLTTCVHHSLPASYVFLRINNTIV